MLGQGAAAFRRRAELYSRCDAMLCPYTRFFAAAAAINRDLAKFFTVFRWVRSRRFLSDAGAALEVENLALSRQVYRLGTGITMDQALVRAEQALLQRHIHNSQACHPKQWRLVRQDLNRLLNGGIATALLFYTDTGGGALSQALDEVRRHLSGEIDFAVEAHRVLIGQKLIEHIRGERVFGPSRPPGSTAPEAYCVCQLPQSRFPPQRRQFD